MKRFSIIFLCLFSLLLSSCISAKTTNYADVPEDYTSVCIILDSNKTTISSGGYMSYSNNTMTYIPSSSEDAVLNTVKNKVLMQTTLQEKGYKVLNNENEADMLILGGYETNELYTDVILAFYDRKTNDLLFTAEGRFGLGLDIQMDVNGALKKALEQVPSK